MSDRHVFDDVRARQILGECFRAALGAALAGPAVARNLPPKPKGRCVVVGAGKASAAMAAAVDTAWPDVALCGVISTRYGHALSAGRIGVIEAGHPVPDENSMRAARAMLDAVSGLGEDDLVLALVSGGGSASLALPAQELDLAGKQSITRSLLRSGAPIHDLNTVRRHISAIKDGRLAAAAHPAKVVTLLISDVPGDDPTIISSGPTLANGTTGADALRIIDHYRVAISDALRQRLSGQSVSPSPLQNGEYRLVATPAQALRAASQRAAELGVKAIVLGDALEGESATLGREMALDILARRRCDQAPFLLLSGGETTVTIGPEGAGKGGRNTEFLLSLALGLDGAQGIWALAADTDGIDGSEDAAGAVIAPDTLSRAFALGLDSAEILAGHDSYSLFAALGDLLVTGPTYTNVNDFRAILVGEPIP